MMAGVTPWEANQRLLQGGAFDGDLIIDERAAKALEMNYNGKKLIGSIPNPTKPCIMETKLGGSQHFIVWLGFPLNGKDQIIDPWTGKVTDLGSYPIISWRLFEEKKKSKSDLIDEIEQALNQLKITQ